MGVYINWWHETRLCGMCLAMQNYIYQCCNMGSQAN